MIKLFSKPAHYPFIAIRHVIEYDEEGNIKNPPPLSIKALTADELEVVTNATTETLFDMFSSLYVHDIPETDLEMDMAVLIAINQQCNEVARVSRRGVANVLIASAEALERIRTEMFLSTRPGAKIIRNDELPGDEAIVLYINPMETLQLVDAPFAYDGTDLRMLPDWQNYCRRFKIA